MKKQVGMYRNKKIPKCEKTLSGYHIWQNYDDDVLLEEESAEKLLRCIACGFIDDSYIKNA
jgi:hypothetical protein